MAAFKSYLIIVYASGNPLSDKKTTLSYSYLRIIMVITYKKHKISTINSIQVYMKGHKMLSLQNSKII